MAYTKIHAIKASVGAAIKYICNPAKTDEQILIDSYGCSPETAPYDFKFSLSKGRSSDNNKAFHLIQSFMPEEVSYSEAHNIGIELADRLLEGKYSYVIATHIDHNHIHNHIVFCATDNINHKKYDDNRRSYYHIRQLSDELCESHNLSIISPGPKRGMKYNEWAARNNGTSWKAKLQTDIDDCIKISKNYEHFIALIKAKGYEIKGEEFTDNAPKYISFRPLDGKQFIRGSERSLGPGYTKENIKNRIDTNIKSHQNKIPFPKKPSPIISEKTQNELLNEKKKDLLKAPPTALTNPNTDKMLNSPGLRQWANIQNLKAAAHIYAIYDTIEELQAKIEEKEVLFKTTKASLVAIEKKMKPASEILHYADMYITNLKYHNAYNRSKDPDRYYRNHDTELNLFNAAEHVLRDKYHINPAKMNYKNMQESYSLMEDKKTTLSTAWKSSEQELHELQVQLKALQEYLGTAGAEYLTNPIHDKKYEKDNTQSRDNSSKPNKKGQQL